jgi:hypothetical protein
MLFMDEATLIAHALRDFLRSQVASDELLPLDISMNAGEPYSALSSGLGIAQRLSVSIPPLFIERILALPGWNDFDREVLAEQIGSLPSWFRIAS